MKEPCYLAKISFKVIVVLKNILIFAPANKKGAIAQLVEQRTENPCVPGSIPGGTTIDSVISQNPLKFSHFNGFSFILQYANSSRFEYLECGSPDIYWGLIFFCILQIITFAS